LDAFENSKNKIESIIKDVLSLIANGNNFYSSINKQTRMTKLENPKELSIDEERISFNCSNSELYKCGLCLEICREPKKCSECQSTNCSSCFSKSVEKNNECPFCRNKPFKEQRLSPFERSHFEKLMLKCNLCDQVIIYNDLIKHIKEDHKEGFYKCNCCNENIKAIIGKGDPNLPENIEIVIKCHEDNCKIKCLFCNNNLPFIEFVSHDCPKKMKCNMCSMTYPQIYEEAHQIFYCQKFKLIKEDLERLLNLL